jgi:myo-inositol-1-phosphate synthase
LVLLQDGVRFFRPSAVVTDHEGNIYVKDNKVIARFDKDGNHVMSFGKEVLNVPYGRWPIMELVATLISLATEILISKSFWMLGKC